MSQGYYQEIRLIKIAARAGRLLAKPSYSSPHLKPAIPIRSRYSVSTNQLCPCFHIIKLAYIGIDALKKERDSFGLDTKVEGNGIKFT